MDFAEDVMHCSRTGDNQKMDINDTKSAPEALNDNQSPKEEQNNSLLTLGPSFDLNFDSTTITPELDLFMKELQTESALFIQTLHNKGRAFTADLLDEAGASSMGSSQHLDDTMLAAGIPAESLIDMVPSKDWEAMFQQSDRELSQTKGFKDEDDEMDEEMRRLSAAEDNLRKELDFACAGFGLLGIHPGSNSKSESHHSWKHSNTQNRLSEEVVYSSKYTENNFSQMRSLDKDEPESYIVKSLLDDTMEGDERDSHNNEEKSGDTSKNEDSYVLVKDGETLKTPESKSNDKGGFDMPNNLAEKAIRIGLNRLPSDLGYYTCPIFYPISPTSSQPSEELAKTDSTHADCLKLRQQLQEQSMFRQHFAREYVAPMSTKALRKLYAGLTDPKSSKYAEVDNTDLNKIPTGKKENLLLASELTMLQHPVRTCVVRVRPDVLCGSIADSIAQVLLDLNAEILKRQGGHLRAIIPPTYRHEQELSFRLSARQRQNMTGAAKPIRNNHTSDEVKLLQALIVDTQVCTKKRSKECERVLIIRAFAVPKHLSNDIPPTPPEPDIDSAKDYSALNNEQLVETLLGHSATSVLDETDVPCIWDASRTLHDMIINREITEGFVTIDRDSGIIMPPEFESNGRIEKRPTFARTTSKLGSILMSPVALLSGSKGRSHTRNSLPTSTIERDYFPSLSNEDAPLVESAWTFIKNCVDELETRDLAYSSLLSCNFGSFPALSTLDNHYCAQLRMLVRESMVISLLKTASELENYARDAEFSCANFVQLIKPAFELYKIQQPPLPQPIPLSAYPLDFSPPESDCPPWGQKVMEALNRISRESDALGRTTAPSHTNGLDRATRSVAQVVSAFQRQDDEEQSARLGRKNLQVMDRLAKMQAHRRHLLAKLASEYGRNFSLTDAADEVHSKAEHFFRNHCDQENASQPAFFAVDQIPLLQCGIFVGGATGQCFVTAHQLLCTTQLIPLVGGSHYYLFNLQNIHLEVTESPKHSLIQLPPGISISRSNATGGRIEILKLIPSIDAQRFKDFVDLLRAMERETQNSLNFSAKGGFLFDYNEMDKASDGKM